MAAWLEPKPGRKLTKGAEIIEADNDLINEFFFNFIFLILLILCLGISCFFVIEVIKEEIPNNPVNNGNI